MSPLLGLSGFGGGTSRFGGATEISDEYFKYVTLLLHGDGANAAQNNTFLDSSTNNFAITRNGNTTQGAFSPYGDRWSNYFDGSSGALTTSFNSNFVFGTNDFTIECWIYITDGTTNMRRIIGLGDGINGGSLSSTWDLQYNGSESPQGQIALRRYDQTTLTEYFTSGATIPINSWVHIAASRTGGNLRIFVNGTAYYAAANTFNFSQINTNGLYIGLGYYGPPTGYGGPRYFPGYISNVRVINGTGIYSSNFTPPTAPLTAVTNTVLLTCQSNRFIDNSANNFTLTRNGDVRVDKFNPFGRSAAYSSGTEGSSGYFDGSGDYLNTASNAAFGFGSGDFTMECWFYKTTSNLDVLLDTRINAGGNQFGIALYVQSNTLKAGNDAERISGGTLVNNSWNHCALVRSGNNISLYLNGSRTNTTAFSTTLASSASCWIGSSAFSEFAGGYISNARVIKGTAIYTGTTYTIPTSPLTAISNTSLLLNFTNASIIDNSGLSVLETVGNAQLDTAIKKFGTGSLKFDGSGDYLTAGNPPSLDLRSGNFTMESWIYPVNVTGNKAICGTWLNQQGILYLVDSTLSFAWAPYSINIPLLSAGTVSANQWSHVAVTRSGNTFKLFLNGTETASTTSATNATTFTTPFSVGSFIVDGTYTNFFNGYIDDLRVTKGIARYTANFTPPTRAFPNK